MTLIVHILNAHAYLGPDAYPRCASHATYFCFVNLVAEVGLQ